MRTFLGIGAGPIQTGIFVSGAVDAGFDRIVLADVDAELVGAVRESACITVNTAGKNDISSRTFRNIEIYNPQDTFDLSRLSELASEAQVLATALPSTAFYRYLDWIREGFSKKPGQRRYFYAAENSTTAAAELQDAIGAFPETFYLDTVIGKMSKVFTSNEIDLPVLSPGLTRGHLVEEFNIIYSSSALGLEDVAPTGLYSKNDLKPFETAKLYGHNAVHFLLASLAAEKGCRYISEASAYPELLKSAFLALRDECGEALCRKFAGMDDFFIRKNFSVYSSELIERMVSPVLNDSIERIIRNPERKFSWNDRIIGAIRLCLEQGVCPSELSKIQLPDGTDETWKKESNYNDLEASAVMSVLKAGCFNPDSACCNQLQDAL